MYICIIGTFDVTFVAVTVEDSSICVMCHLSSVHAEGCFVNASRLSSQEWKTMILMANSSSLSA